MQNRRAWGGVLFVLGATCGIALWEGARHFPQLSWVESAAAAPSAAGNLLAPVKEAPKPAGAGNQNAAETPIGPRWWPSRWGENDQRDRKSVV